MTKTKRRSKSKSKSKSKKGGFGGWGRETLVGGSWLPPANNTYAQMTSSGARSNHFSLSRHGGMVGGIDPANQGNYGPGSGQIIARVPPLPIGALGSKGGGKRRKQTLKRNRRGKRGGGGFLEFGGFPQLIGTAWDNALNDIKNVANGYNGNKLLPSASGWHQPLAKGYTAPPLKPSTQFLALTTNART
jgi:hypothetical protein